jgi:hypothetical protein
LTDDTDWFVDSVGELVFVGLDGLAVELVRPSTVISDSGNRRRNVGVLGPLKSLAYATVPTNSGCRQW